MLSLGFRRLCLDLSRSHQHFEAGVARRPRWWQRARVGLADATVSGLAADLDTQRRASRQRLDEGSLLPFSSLYLRR